MIDFHRLPAVVGLSCLWIAALLVPATAAETIVGAYYALTEAGDCTEDGGRVNIGHMSITQRGAKCAFNSVQRQGTKVTWRGLCQGLESWAGAKVVTAHPEGDVLVVQYGSLYTAKYKKCAR